jgi:uncharacterized protein
VKLVDANVLLNAVNRSAPQHAAARTWLEAALGGGAIVGFAWLPLLAFVRISTMANIFERPLTPLQATGWVSQWLQQPSAREVSPTAHHAAVLAEMMKHVELGGNLANDAHLAALAIEHKASVVSFDRDFSRFPRVKHEIPTG